MAESWTTSADGLTYTFKLRKGVKFHTTENFKPSRDFNADDVIFTMSRMVADLRITCLWTCDSGGTSITTSPITLA